MFDYTLLHWTTFFSAAILLNIAPGPDMAFILAQTARKGRQGGFAAMLGIWTGTFLHVMLAAAGLSVILATSAIAFSIVKWAGVAYLIFLGGQALFSREGEGRFSTKKPAKEMQMRAIYGQGILVSALNPKVAIFFLAFLPQFVVTGAGPISAQLLLHGSLIIVVAALIEPPLVFAGSRLATALRNNERVGLWLDRSLGAMLIALGIWLALGD
ncbi:MAG: LysE family translocator [Anaerolineales bacterium]|nr:LysE family translocator [Anaerolineales bacterium]